MDDSQDNQPKSSFLKKKGVVIVLILFILLGFYLRVYHVDYPVVGYHNWKETHYLTEARNFAREGFFSAGFFVPMWDYPGIYEDQNGSHSDTFPTTPIIVGLLFNIFGISLTLARLTNIFLSLGSIFFMYLIVKNLFNREDLALLSAFILAINPLNIFFGRQMDLINSALFFTLAGTYFYLLWLKLPNWKNTILFSIFFALGVLTKYTFVLLFFPMLFIFPFKKLLDKSMIKKHLFILFIAILSLAWVLYIPTVSTTLGEELESTELGLVFSSEFWNVMKSFFSDNYTLYGVWLFVVGAVLFTLFSIKSKKYKTNVGYKYFLVYLASSIPWFVYMSYKLQGHNYHQYPLLPLYCLIVAYSILFISVNAAKIINVKKLKWVFVIILLFFLLTSSITSKNRMFDTQFIGLDVAGDYINNNKLPGERVVHSSHQAYGLLWHADVKGTGGIPSKVDDLKYALNNLSAPWLFAYNWDFAKIFEDPELSEFIQSNYHLEQLGFIQSNGNYVPVYILLKHGGSFSEVEINLFVSSREMKTREYENSNGKYSLLYVDK